MRPIPVECFRCGESARCGKPTGSPRLRSVRSYIPPGSTATLCRRATTRLLTLGLFTGLRIGELHRPDCRDILRANER